MKKNLLIAIALVFAISCKPSSDHKIKNVILMIGDGMGPQQIGLLDAYAQKAPKSIYNGKRTALAELMNVSTIGVASNSPIGALVIDSAAAGSHLATGVYSPSESIGLDIDGNPVETVLELAKKYGKATGLITDTRITHATPAAFAAHQFHRSKENTIAEEMLANGVDVMLGGGLRYWIPQAVNKKEELYKSLLKTTGGKIKIKSKRKDNKNLLNEAKKSGYDVVHSKKSLLNLSGNKVLGLFSYSAMPDGIKHSLTKNNKNRTIPTLKEMTIKTLDILSKNENGFFLMIEAGLIDWAAHDNDASTLLHELLKFDETIKYVHEWVKDRDDTLLIVTADHETGGFSFSYSRANLPKAKKLSGTAFKNNFYKPNYNFGDVEILDKLYSQKKSYKQMISEYLKTDKKPKSLMKIVNDSSEFKISLKDARRILEMEKNEYYVEGHKYLGSEEFPKIDDFKSFYVYGEELQYDLIGRAMSEEQNVAWGTGTHTQTPVITIAFGPGSKNFSRFTHQIEVGKLLKEAVKNNLK